MLLGWAHEATADDDKVRSCTAWLQHSRPTPARVSEADPQQNASGTDRLAPIRVCIDVGGPSGLCDTVTMHAEQVRAGVETALGRGVSDERRIELLLSLARIYEEEAVLTGGEALPLWRHCRCAEPCWAALPQEWQPGRDPADPWNGGIVFPWIGAQYAARGVAVLGINLREASGLFVEYEIAFGQFDCFEAGREKPHGSWWAYRSTRAAAAVLRSIAGDDQLDVQDPVALGPMLDATARMQSVKCSPKDGARSERTPEMKANCPSRYLIRELSVLRPRVLVSFGREAWDAVAGIAEIKESVCGDHFSRSEVRIDDLAFEMLWLHHPSSMGDLWQQSFEILIDNLSEQPITA